MRTLFSSSHRGSCFIAILLFSSSVSMDNAKAEEAFSATLSLDIEAGYLIDDESSFRVTLSDDLSPDRQIGSYMIQPHLDTTFQYPISLKE